MASTITLTGTNEFITAIENVNSRLIDAIPSILKKGAEPVRKEASLKCNRSLYTKKHLQDNIIITDAQGDGANQYVEVGAAKGLKGEFFYAKFLEFGTVKNRAYPFMEPAVKSKAGESLEIIAQEVKGVIESV